MIICLQTKIIVSNPQVILFIFFCAMRFFDTAVHAIIHPNTMSSFSCLRSNDTENNAERRFRRKKIPLLLGARTREIIFISIYTILMAFGNNWS